MDDNNNVKNLLSYVIIYVIRYINNGILMEIRQNQEYYIEYYN